MPDGVKEHFTNGAMAESRSSPPARELGSDASREYRTDASRPKLAAELDLRCCQGKLPDGWDVRDPGLPRRYQGPRQRATAAGKVLNAIAPQTVPDADGRIAADLAPSTKTNLTFQGRAARSSRAEYSTAATFHFGVREHAMGVNRQRHGAVLPAIGYTGSTFSGLRSTTCARRSVSSAIMETAGAVFVFTHDSASVWARMAPTHQPIEHLATLRSIPGDRHDPPR